ncbi:MAG TPA: type IV pilus biogenesis/stability protein PilW [Steroidobacteraceae bacterium]|nr:type IV pilus biogenesis/stability protein PilW [Steroidobacteraceae bacterium]
MMLNSRKLHALAALFAAGILTACSHNPPAYQQPVRTYKKQPAQAAVANMQLAIEYMKLGQLANARDCIERALTQNASNPDVQSTAGLVFERLNEMGKAERAYETAARLSKNDPRIANSYAGFLCRTGKTAAGEKMFNEVARNPLYPTPAVALVNAGVCVRGAGNLVDADRYFTRALAIRPNMPEALLQQGNVAFDRGDAEQARDIVQRYLAVNPPTPEILWLGFRAQRKLGDPVAAAIYARRVQAEFPNSEQAQNMRNGVDR